jgi:AcrR family transcriptional regulator
MTFVSSDRAAATERHLARVAARLFAERGYDATSVREIVEAAGVKKPTLYYHFGSKEGLAQALLTRPLTALVEQLQAIVTAGGEPVEVLARVFEAHFAFFREEPDRARFYFALAFGPHGKSGLVEELFRFSKQMDALMLEAVKGVVDAGLVDPSRAGDLVGVCCGTVTRAAMDYLYKPDKDVGPAPGLAGRLVDDLLWGFARAGGGRQGGRR